MAFKGYGIFDENAQKRKNYKYRDVSQLIHEAKHYKSEQEPEEVAQSLQEKLLKAMDANHITEFEREIKMAKEISDEEMKPYKNGVKGAKHPKVEDEVVSVKFTKDVDLAETYKGLMTGGHLYDPQSDIIIGEEGMNVLRDAIEEAHKKGEKSISVAIPMSYRYPSNEYEFDKETGKFIPQEASQDDMNKIANRDGFYEVKGHPGLWKSTSENKYILVDPKDPHKGIEAKNDGSIKYKKHHVNHPKMFVKDKDSENPGYKMTIDKETGEPIPMTQKYTFKVDLKYTIGMEITKDDETITKGAKWDEHGRKMKDDKTNQPLQTGKLSGNSPKDSEDWKKYREYMARMEHVGEKYARNPTKEAARELAGRLGHSAANEAYRTSINMVTRAPFQMAHEASARGDRQISEIVRMLMPAIEGRTR